MDSLVSIRDFQRHFEKILPLPTLAFYQEGAGNHFTLRENEKAFDRLRLRPRMLRDVVGRDQSVTVLNRRISLAVGISPTAMQAIAHPDGEIAMAKAAEAAGSIYIMSTMSTYSIEDVAEAAPNGIKWFQLYMQEDRVLSANLIRRAEATGFQAIVFTVDLPVQGFRYDSIRSKFAVPSHLRLANFVDDGGESLQDPTGERNLDNYVVHRVATRLTWDDVTWLRSLTTLPIILKGILTAEDAVLAVEAGASAIIVSNHGGRQLDGAPATIEALPEIVRAASGHCEVYLDSGVRSGTDVFKALALGARMVFVGRPALWGLAYKGQDGVKAVLDIFKTEIDTTMALAGCRSINDITRDMVMHQSNWNKL